MQISVTFTAFNGLVSRGFPMINYESYTWTDYYWQTTMELKNYDHNTKKSRNINKNSGEGLQQTVTNQVRW